MDTERFIPVKNLKSWGKINVPSLNVMEKNICEVYIELTRHIQEIHQLFLIFRFNLKSMLNNYTLMNSDRIVRSEHIPSGFTDFISINALVINYISSGKTLLESIENNIRHSFGNDSEAYVNFRNLYLVKTYDDCFNYRFVTRLRDFSQHGHLPISFQDGKCCFDLTQIINTPHFNHNKSNEKNMLDLKDEILLKYGDEPRIAFTLTLAEYNLCVTSIYKSFWDSIRPALVDSNKNIHFLLSSRPEIITCFDNVNLVFYHIDDYNVAHAFNVNGNSTSMLDNYENEADKILSKEQEEFYKLKSETKLIKKE